MVFFAETFFALVALVAVEAQQTPQWIEIAVKRLVAPVFAVQSALVGLVGRVALIPGLAKPKAERKLLAARLVAIAVGLQVLVFPPAAEVLR